ncbi:ParB/Sulfiredoxin [uncultured Caudovirales phage]|uniref:ParB/Sulfiredoxin n=1 Tax=uncultured Caudovirales phage TaxID=2100421 RepID=A0A6J5SX64_9CAUD|nr:ParB/Sulfiredoxin [uncultured Caudovirales phage]
MFEKQIVKISAVKSNPNNPRIIKDENFQKLVNSIKEFPEMMEIRPIVVNDDMIILGGNMRFKASKEAGLKEIPIIKVSGLSAEKQREFVIKDNVSGGEWDWGLLQEWDSLELESWGLDIPIFKDAENELKDLSSEIENLYRIEVTCKDEEHQEIVYNKLIEQGYECRLLTL